MLAASFGVTVPLLIVASLLPVVGSDGPAFLLQWGGQGSAPGQLNFAHHFAVTPAGKVYVGDLLNERVQEFGPTGNYVRHWPMHSADGVAVAPDGRIYVCGSNLVARFSAEGVFQTSWGSTGSGPGQFQFALDIAVDALGFVYVTDWMNHRVQKFTANGAYVSEWGTEGTGNGQFQLPFGIFYDPAGFVLVADGAANRIQRFTLTGAFISAWGSTGSGPGEFDSMGRPCIDPDGFVLVPDAGNHRIQVLRADGSFVTAWGSFGTGPGQFNHPTCVATDGTGAVYVVDKDNHRIQKFADVATATRSRSWGMLKSRYR